MISGWIDAMLKRWFPDPLKKVGLEPLDGVVEISADPYEWFDPEDGRQQYLMTWNPDPFGTTSR